MEFHDLPQAGSASVGSGKSPASGELGLQVLHHHIRDTDPISLFGKFQFSIL